MCATKYFEFVLQFSDVSMRLIILKPLQLKLEQNIYTEVFTRKVVFLIPNWKLITYVSTLKKKSNY